MNDLQYLMELKYYGNTLAQYAWALLFFIVAWAVLYVLKRLVVRALTRIAQRTTNAIDDFIALQLSRTGVLLNPTIALYFSTRNLELPPRLDLALLYLMLIVLTYRLVRIIQETVGFAFERAMHVAGEDRRAEMSSLRTFNWLLNGIIWLIAILFLLSNFGINISSFIAGLGIGGVAVALAAQSILGDFFASLTILLDKPFRIGDAITTGDVTGTVESIGIKTSRIRSVTGEVVVVGNSDLTGSRIRNMKEMRERRVLQRFGIRYETKPELARAVPEIVRGIITNTENVRFDRVHLAAFGDFALIYEAVYFVLTPDYVTFMNLQQDINLRILDAFAGRDIHFAYPTQTIHLQAGSTAKEEGQ